MCIISTNKNIYCNKPHQHCYKEDRNCNKLSLDEIVWEHRAIYYVRTISNNVSTMFQWDRTAFYRYLVWWVGSILMARVMTTLLIYIEKLRYNVVVICIKSTIEYTHIWSNDLITKRSAKFHNSSYMWNSIL